MKSLAVPSFTYTIRNLQLDEPVRNSPAWAFHEYLKTFFIFLRVASRVPTLRLTAPVFFFASDRALSRGFEVQAGQLTEQSYFDGWRSAYQAAIGESMNLMQWGAQHFVRLHRNAVIESSTTDQTWQHFFVKYEDVQLLTRYLRQLGYEWNFWHDPDQLRYVFLLDKDGMQFSPDMFSSGEREIVHFLLAMFALNVTGGLVLVDEPELHLHPRWQQMKDPLTDEDASAIEQDLSRLRSDNIFVLRHGEIEDYLPSDARELKSIVEALADRNWINRVADADRRLELGTIVCAILDVPAAERVTFCDQLKNAAVAFPLPGSENAHV